MTWIRRRPLAKETHRTYPVDAIYYMTEISQRMLDCVDRRQIERVMALEVDRMTERIATDRGVEVVWRDDDVVLDTLPHDPRVNRKGYCTVKCVRRVAFDSGNAHA